jgi:uncharacterized protein YcfL
MRNVFFLLSLLSLPLVGCGAPRAQTPTGGRDVGGTHVDGADLALDLPGRWDEAPVEAGHDLRKGPPGQQEIVAVLMPAIEGLDAGKSAAHLSDAQRKGMSTLCKRGVVASSSTPATTIPGAMRVHVTCEEPSIVATYVARPYESEVLSYEHYWYDVPGYSAALDSADDAILSGLQVHPLTTACPSVVVEQTTSKGGTCLEAAVLGQAAVDRCGQALASRGWMRDDVAAEAIGRQTAKTLVCYRRSR